MRKRIFGIFLIVCMIVGLLPIVALADEPKTAKVGILSKIDMAVTEGGAPAYLKNSSYEGFTKDGAANGTGWTQVKGNADDWNIKFEYPVGGTPTLTLKDAKLDIIGDSGVMYTKGSDGSFTSKGNLSAILPKACTDIKVIVQGDNHIEVNYGIVRGLVSSSQYFKNVTIVGENGGKISGRGGTFSLVPGAGYDLTIENATLDLKTANSKGSEPIPIRASNGNITIKNSTITCGNNYNCAILAQNGGNITIIDSKITATSKLTSTAGSGVICASGTLTIDGEKTELHLDGQNNPGLSSSTCVIVNNGNIAVTSPYYGVMANGDEASIILLGGTIEVTAQRAFNKAPTLGQGMEGWAGLAFDDEDIEPYGSKAYNKPWVKFSNDPSKLPTTVPTTKPTTAPTTKPTTPPTTNTTAATKAPTTAATKAPTKAPVVSNDTEVLTSQDVILLIVSGLILIAGAVIVVLIKKNKKK